MIKKNRAQIVAFIIHKVGNKYNSTRNLFSHQTMQFDENSYQLALNFLLKPFTNLTESYRFTHHIDVSENALSNLTDSLLYEDDFVATSKKIVNHLFEQSNSANIKTGDVMVVKFTDIEINNILTDAIGIFKIENKSDFFQTYVDGDNIELMLLEGISTKKLDKGCLIINTTDDEGRIVLSIDSNNYDAQYWIKNFLNIKPANDSNGKTKKYMELCNAFSEEIIKEQFGKKKQNEFLANTLDYLKENETLNLDYFKVDVLQEDEKSIELFNTFKKEYQLENDVTIENSFIVSDKVVKKEKKMFKKDIKLDTNITIKIDVDAPDTASYYLERGFDDDKKMFYYKVFFNEEK